MKIQTKRIIYFTCVILCMTAIFIFSSQNASISGNLSGGITKKLAQFFVKNFNDMNIVRQTEIVETMHFYIRKTAHFTIYAALGFFMYGSVNTYTIKVRKKIMITLLFCLIYAASDEFHQLFSDGRSGSPRDIFIDFCGSLTGCFISCGIYKLIKNFEKSIDK